jgi:MFS family permease
MTQPAPEPTAEQRRGMRYGIVTQCLGCLSMLAFTNNLLLLYMTALGIPPARIVMYLSMPMAVGMVVQLPAAWASEHYGKKRLGTYGLVAKLPAYSLIIAAAWLAPPGREIALATGIVGYSVSNAVFASGWFALLSPIVPEHVRGRFFGRLRYLWQTVGILFAILCALVLTEDSPLRTFALILTVVLTGLLLRVFAFRGVPELEPVSGNPGRFLHTIQDTVQRTRFMAFNAYVFLLALFTAGCPALFGLIEKGVVGLPDSQVAWLGALMMAGSVVGYVAAARAVDRIGTKLVFLTCHLGYGAVLLLFVFREWSPAGPFLTLGALRFGFGLVMALSSVAMSAEMLALIPAHNKAISTSVHTTMARAGAGASGVLAGWVIDAGMLRDTWQAWGLTLSNYDAILLGGGTMVVVLVVTLSLVPSVVGKAGYTPQG